MSKSKRMAKQAARATGGCTGAVAPNGGPIEILPPTEQIERDALAMELAAKLSDAELAAALAAADAGITPTAIIPKKETTMTTTTTTPSLLKINPGCGACGGTGYDSRGGYCYPCQVNGWVPIPTAAASAGVSAAPKAKAPKTTLKPAPAPKAEAKPAPKEPIAPKAKKGAHPVTLTEAKPAATPKPAAKAEADGAPKIRKPQLRVLAFLARQRKPVTRKTIAEGSPCDMAWASTFLGDVNPEKRAARDVKDFPSLITLGYAMVQLEEGEGSKSVDVYSITPAGREYLKSIEG